MSHFERSIRSQFFLTGPRPCPYLPDRRERKLFTNLIGGRAEALHDELAQLGFRRSQNIAYRPACQGCSACVSTRVPVRRFAPTRSQKRVAKRNRDLLRRIAPPWPTDEHYQLFKTYLVARHAEGGMVEMDALDFAAMVEDSPVRTHLVEYYATPAGDDAASGGSAAGAEPAASLASSLFASDGDACGLASIAAAPSAQRGARLVASCVTDVLADGLSLVYSFFDPELDRRSLGRHIILDHIEIAKDLGLDHVYLGYWVEGSRKMDYKIEFRPAEVLRGNRWVEL